MSINIVVYEKGHFINMYFPSRNKLDRWWHTVPMDEREGYHINVLFMGPYAGYSRLVAVKPLGLQAFYEIAGSPGSEGAKN